MKRKLLLILTMTIMVASIAMPATLAVQDTPCDVPSDIDLSELEVDCIQNMLVLCDRDDIADLFPELAECNNDIQKYDVKLNSALEQVCKNYNIECNENTTKEDLLKEITSQIDNDIKNTDQSTDAVCPTPSKAFSTPTPSSIPQPEATPVQEQVAAETATATPVATPAPTPEQKPITTPDTSTDDIAPIAPPTATPKPPVASNSSISALEMDMINMVNQDRANAGLAPLAASSQVSTKARDHSKDMSSDNYFSHTSPTYGGFSERLKNSGLSYVTAGENIALYGSIEKAQAGLMSSDGHRANILGKNFTHVGIGIVYNSDKSAYYITQWFTKQ